MTTEKPTIDQYSQFFTQRFVEVLAGYLEEYDRRWSREYSAQPDLIGEMLDASFRKCSAEMIGGKPSIA